jgi:hypothetical protein
MNGQYNTNPWLAGGMGFLLGRSTAPTSTHTHTVESVPVEVEVPVDLIDAGLKRYYKTHYLIFVGWLSFLSSEMRDATISKGFSEQNLPNPQQRLKMQEEAMINVLKEFYKNPSMIPMRDQCELFERLWKTLKLYREKNPRNP